MARADCPPESGGQRDREADPARGGSHIANLQDYCFGTTPALRATPPDSGGEFQLLRSNWPLHRKLLSVPNSGFAIA